MSSTQQHLSTPLINGTKSPTPQRSKNQTTVIVGAQWGDEGKGKIVDLLAVKADVVCRCAVSPFMQLLCGYRLETRNSLSGRK